MDLSTFSYSHIYWIFLLPLIGAGADIVTGWIQTTVNNNWKSTTGSGGSGMTIINTSPNRPTQLGYEGEDRVTVLRFRYGADWLENGEGIFRARRQEGYK